MSSWNAVNGCRNFVSRICSYLPSRFILTPSLWGGEDTDRSQLCTPVGFPGTWVCMPTPAPQLLSPRALCEAAPHSLPGTGGNGDAAVTTVTADTAERLLPVCPELAASCTLFCVIIVSSLQLIKVKCNVLTCPRTRSDGVTPFLGLGGSFARWGVVCDFSPPPFHSPPTPEPGAGGGHQLSGHQDPHPALTRVA